MLDILTLNNVSRQFPEFNLQGISFSLEPGYIVATHNTKLKI